MPKNHVPQHGIKDSRASPGSYSSEESEIDLFDKQMLLLSPVLIDKLRSSDPSFKPSVNITYDSK